MINPSNEYAVHAYELGFQHAKAKIETPIKRQCDRLYWLGYQIANQ